MQRLVAVYFTGQFGRFLIVGGVAAFGVGFLSAFILNKVFVFPASGKPLREEMGCFFLFKALAFPVVLGASILLNAHVLGPWLPAKPSEAVAHAIAVISPVFVNFAAHKFITFRRL